MKRAKPRPRQFETLEHRYLLAADPVISEFMPDNDDFLFDEDGDSPDWIEVSNQGDEAIDLSGWYLTDDATNLDKWQFPTTTLEAGQAVVVFASGKDRAVAGGELHTDFRLNADGEELLLVQPDAITVASQFAPYPFVPENVSYGRGLVVLNQEFVPTGAEATVFVPSTANGGDQLGTSWTNRSFDDATWIDAQTSIGYGGGELTLPMQLHWTLDDTNIVVLDSSGNGNNALKLPGNATTNTGDVAPVPTGSAASLSFDGVNDAIVANAYEGILGNDARSVSTWIKTTKEPANGVYAPTLVHWGGAGTGGRFTFRINENPNNGTVGGLRVEVAGGFIVANTDLTDGQWHHVAATFDPADGGGIGTVQMYVDGDNDGVSGQGNNVTVNTVAGDRVTLGDGPAGGLNRNLEGLMDDVRIYDRALTADDITALHSGSGPSTDIGTDVGDLMLENNASIYVRFPFNVANIDEVDELTLTVDYDDGYIAFINGQEVARANAAVGSDWDSAATDTHDRGDAQLVSIPVTADLLRNGENVLALHGLNVSADDADFFLLPTLTGTGITTTSLDGYFATPTPGAANNEVDLQTGTLILDVNSGPSEPADSDEIIVTAEIDVSGELPTNVVLNYRVMYADEIALDMQDNGLGDDLAANDGIYTATIPSSAAQAGEMVRWYVTTETTSKVVTRNPLWDDTVVGQDNAPEYYGTMIADPAVDSDLPVLYWFLEPGTESSARTTSGTRTSVFYAGEFYENAFVRVRGGSTAGLAKNSFKIDFNQGNHFRFDPNHPRVSEINLNTTTTDKAYVRQSLTFDTYDAVGAPGSISFPLRLQRNGEFFSVAVFVEQPNEDLLEREGLDPEGALYKMFNTFTSSTNVEKKTRHFEDNSDLAAFISGLNGASGEALRHYVFDNVDVPGMVSYLVATVLSQNNDQQAKNYYLYRDTNGTGEWVKLPWDLDLTFGFHFMTNDSVRDDEIWADADNILGGAGNNVPISPSHPYAGEQEHPGNRSWNRLIDKLYELPEFREMFLRRLRTTMDQLLGVPDSPISERWFESRIDAMVEQIGTDATLDFQAWADPWDYGLNLSIDEAVDRLKTLYLDVRRAHLFVTHSIDNLGAPDIVGIPHAQAGNPQINFGATDHSPISGNQDEEFIELLNPNSEAVDISGWRLTGGVEHTFKPGTVIRAGDKMYVSPDVTAFRNRATGPSGGQGLFVQGAYAGHLSRFGETVELVASDGTRMDSFTTPDAPSDVQRFLRVSELHFNPAEGDEKEFIEVTNISAAANARTLDLSGVTISQGPGEPFVFPAGTSLAPSEYLLVVRDIAAFQDAYPAVPPERIVGQYSGALANGGERIKLDDADNNTVIDFTYDDVDPWFERADGTGASLEAILDGATEDTTFTKHYHWRASTEFGGSPGTAGVGPMGIVVNEVLTNSDTHPDSIELLNTSTDDIDIGGWFLSDANADLMKFEIPVGTVIAAGGYVVFSEEDFNPTPESPGPKDFALDGSGGDDVWLVVADGGRVTQFADDVHFGATPNDNTLARNPNGAGRLTLSSRNTLGCGNSLHQLSRLVVSEIQYAPTQPSADALLVDPNIQVSDLEFVEVHNPTETALDLTGWRLRGGVDYDFVDGQRIAPGQALVIVPFNPESDANTTRVAAFRAHYGLDETTHLIGGYAGQLSNSGETIRLRRPDLPPADNPTFTPYVTVDEVLYDDSAPWPTTADGMGDSLNRLAPVRLGNATSTWAAVAANPGTVSYADGKLGDMNGDGVVSVLDIDALIDAINSEIDVADLDSNADGELDSDDLVEVLASIGSLLGDADLDGVVGASDLNQVGLHWLDSGCLTWSDGDFTGDSAVTAADLNVVGINWQRIAVAAPRAARPPRPALAKARDVTVTTYIADTTDMSRRNRSAVQRRRMTNVSEPTAADVLVDRLFAELGLERDAEFGVG